MAVIRPHRWKNLWITPQRGSLTKHILVGVIAAAAGVLFIASHITARGTDLRTGGVEDLRDLVIYRAGHVAKLTAKANELDAKVRVLAGENIPNSLTTKVKALDEQAGNTGLLGPGLVVTLNDAPREPGSALPDGVSPDDLVVHQQDVQAVVNAFWRGGAKGVQVMDQRLISTSAIRCVGNTLLLQGRVYSPPFRISAIGNVPDLEEALYSEPGVIVYRDYVKQLNLGWDVKIKSSMYLPAWRGSIS
ncbi:MAG: DUF881 domain-containing protein [Actinobacteria bacterium]|nr:DUF881 domain-containing protein [Actinomycetota bacterium]NBY15928.1 DUF881 domain-containing protein [Actinomycetota bacterium]